MDAAHEWTEREINRLSRRLGRLYRRAHGDVKKAYESMLASYAKEREMRLAALDDTDEARMEFQKWCKRQSAMIAQRAAMIDELAQQLTLTDIQAREIADGALPRIYAKNYNYSVGFIKSELGTMPEGVSFTLVDERTVRELVTKNPRLLPIPPTVERGTSAYVKAMAYNRRQITMAVTQGIIQGESIPKISKRIGNVYGRGSKAATRYARTACTCAQNSGRLESYRAARDMGIDITKEWMATGDERTRPTHLEADGQVVGIEEPFLVGMAEMMEPGAPEGGSESWNCRCTMRARVKGMRASKAQAKHLAEIEAERKRRNGRGNQLG